MKKKKDFRVIHIPDSQEREKAVAIAIPSLRLCSASPIKFVATSGFCKRAAYESGCGCRQLSAAWMVGCDETVFSTGMGNSFGAIVLLMFDAFDTSMFGFTFFGDS